MSVLLLILETLTEVSNERNELFLLVGSSAGKVEA